LILNHCGASQGSLSYKLIVVPSAMDKLPEKDLEFLFTWVFQSFVFGRCLD
jgi:hypothetical protein